MRAIKELIPLLGGAALFAGCGKITQPDEATNAKNDAVRAAVTQNVTKIEVPYREESEVRAPLLSQQWLDKASLSFSPVPFGTVRADIKPALKRVVQESCDEVEDCTYVDQDGVEYYFWEGDALVFKFIDAKRFSGRDVPAFGIGPVRSKKDVLKRVEQFFDGARPLCYAHEEYGSKTACELGMGEGWTKLFFDAKDRLVYIRLDMAQVD